MLTWTNRRPSRRDRLSAARSAPGACEQRTDPLAIETRARIHGKIDAAQRDERRDRRVDVQRRRAVEREVQLFLVLVLLLQHTARTAPVSTHASEAHDERTAAHTRTEH